MGSDQKHRTNLWKALLNLKFHYCDSEELDEILREAMGALPKQVVIKHMILLYLSEERFQEAHDLIKANLKKTENKREAWLSCVELLVRWREHCKK